MTNPKTLREAAQKYAAHFGHDSCGPVCDCGFQELRTALARDEAERAEIVAVLKLAEAVDDNDDPAFAFCAVCFRRVDDVPEPPVPQHAPDCRLAALLRRLGSK